MAITFSSYPSTFKRLKVSDMRQCQSPLLRTLADAACNRVLGVPFDGRGERQGSGVIPTTDTGRGHDPEFPLGKGAGLVENHHVDFPGFLQSQSVPHQDAVGSRPRGRDGDHQGHSQTQCVRASDDQNGRHAGNHFHVEAHSYGPGDGGQGGGP